MPALREHTTARPPTALVRAPGGEQLPPAQSGYDYAYAAETAWLDAQVAAFEIADVRAELDAVTVRLGLAGNWFATHEKTDPLYLKAYRRRAKIEEQERWIRIQLWSRRTRCWTACKDVYLALSYVADRVAWLAAHAPEVDGASPLSFWREVQGDRPPPGEWPPARGEAFIRYRAGQIEYWHHDWLERRLKRHRRRSTKPKEQAA